MSIEITNAFVKQYSANVHMLLEQEGTKLRGLVRNETVRGKDASFDRLGSVNALKKVSRHSKSERVDTPHSRRQLKTSLYYVEDYIDREDQLKMLFDPASMYARKHANAIGRQMDQIIVNALNGNALSVDEDDVTSNVALSASQIIDEDFGTADTNLTVEKIIEAKRKLMSIPGAMNEQGILIINSSAHASLLNQEKATSMDYGTRNLETGMMDTFLGMKIIVLGDGILPGTADGTDTDPVRCFALTPSSIVFGSLMDLNARITEDSQYHFMKRVYTASEFGAVRMEEDLVVAIECVQAA